MPRRPFQRSRADGAADGVPARDEGAPEALRSPARSAGAGDGLALEPQRGRERDRLVGQAPQPGRELDALTVRLRLVARALLRADAQLDELVLHVESVPRRAVRSSVRGG